MPKSPKLYASGTNICHFLLERNFILTREEIIPFFINKILKFTSRLRVVTGQKHNDKAPRAVNELPLGLDLLKSGSTLQGLLLDESLTRDVVMTHPLEGFMLGTHGEKCMMFPAIG